MYSRSQDPEYVVLQEERSASEKKNADAKLTVTRPAIGLIVCSLLGLLYCCGFEVWVFVFNGDDMWSKLATQTIMRAAVIAIPALTAIIYAAMFFGSVQMLRRKSYAWAKAASILALLPCNVLIILTFGFGVWGLVVLRNHEVKGMFR